MGELQDVIFGHRTIRRFTDDMIPDEHRLLMEKAAQRAASSCSGQMYSFVRVVDPDKREGVIKACGKQRPMKDAPLLYVACADLHRLDRLAEVAGGKNRLHALSGFAIASVDAALASQNLVLLAESLGYGTCYIGTCRDRVAELIPTLGLPKRVMPLFGIAIGVPREEPPLRPRVPRELVFHVDTYSEYNELQLKEAIDYMSEVLDEEGYYGKYSKREGYLWRDHLVNKFGAHWMEDLEEDRRKYLESHMKRD